MRMINHFLTFLFALVMFSGMALAQDVVVPSEGSLVESVFALIRMVLVDKPTPAMIALAVSQLLLLALNSGVLDKATGKFKMIAVSLVLTVVPALTLLVSNPEMSWQMILSDSMVLAALQVFAHQIWKHFTVKKD